MKNQTLSHGGKTLLLTLGSTPQVVTETLYALATADPPWIPDRIILATTEHGARLFRKGRAAPEREPIAPLLGSQGMLARMVQQLGLPLSLDCVEVAVPLERDGTPIEDIRTEDETSAFAESLLKIVSEVTLHPDSELHVSLAGGRKTMSFIAGQIMSIFGRHADHLSHVLVEPRELERQDSFWWPGDGSIGSDAARIQLYRVPYLRARAWLDPDHLLDVGTGFSSAVSLASQSLGRLHVEIDLPGGCLNTCGRKIELGPQQLATLALIAIAAKRGVQLETVTDWDPDDRKRRGFSMGGDRYLAHRIWSFLYYGCDLAKIYDDGPITQFTVFDGFVSRLADSFSINDHVASPFSRLRQELFEELPPALAERIVASKGFSTLLDPMDVTIVGPSELSDHIDWPSEIVPR